MSARVRGGEKVCCLIDGVDGVECFEFNFFRDCLCFGFLCVLTGVLVCSVFVCCVSVCCCVFVLFRLK